MSGEDQEYKYQLFISYTEADRKWAEQLYRRLQDRSVKVFFAHESIAPGEKITLQVSDALDTSYKVAMVMSPDYFARPWPRAEWSSALMKDPENRDRRLIPLLRCECDIPDLLADLKAIDFTNNDDFELSFLKLLEVVEDKPKPRPDNVFERHFLNREFDISERDLRSYKRGKSFEEEVATLYRLFGFDVKQDVQLNGMQIDLLIEKREGGLLTQAVVECKDKKITAAERDQILAQQSVALRANPRLRWIAVSSLGFAADTRAALESAGVDCVIAADLRRDLLPLEDYVGGLIADYERESIQERWQGGDWFVRPDFQKDRTGETIPALEYMAKWFGDDRKRQLVILGDVGTGKSTLVQFLAYQMARSYLQDPVRHPAPVLVPLGRVRKESSLAGVIHEHFASRSPNGSGINFQRFLHLVHEGRIVLFFDAFDEMADRLDYGDTFNTFRELSRAAQLQGKVVITGRVNYFKDVDEQRELIEEAYRAKGKDIYREATREPGHEVTYLKYFDEPKIRAYLGHARAATAEDDWQKIVQIYDLRGLAQLPLLLTMISDSLDKFAEGEKVDAAKLYEKYTNDWLTRDLEKGRVILRRESKLNLMYELAWRLWNDPDRPMRYRELAAFVEEMGKAGVVELSGKEIEQMAGAIHLRSFLKREGENAFSFIHRSFMEYFLARRLFNGLTASPAETGLLNTRRFNHRVVHFLASIQAGEDAEDRITPVLQSILTEGYRPRISENALTILYWSARVCCGMDTEIAEDGESLERLRAELAKRLPSGIQLAGAQLSGVELLYAPLVAADFTAADLSKAKFDHADLTEARLTEADLTEATLANVIAQRAGFTKTKLDLASFASANLTDADFTEASDYTPDKFADAELAGTRGLTGVSGKINLTKLAPVAQNFAPGDAYGFYGKDFPLAFSPDSELLAIGAPNGSIFICKASDLTILRTLAGHTASVLSVAFSPDGQTLASASYDKSVRLWSPENGECLAVLGSTEGFIRSVAFAPAGGFVCGGGRAGRLQIWDAKSGESVLWIYNFGEEWLMVMPDGRFDVSSPEALRYLRYTEIGTFNSYRAEDLAKEFHSPADVKSLLAKMQPSRESS
ncbi:MAG: TIR domain-containing protein [Blastocatellia bacterium]